MGVMQLCVTIIVPLVEVNIRIGGIVEPDGYIVATTD